MHLIHLPLSGYVITSGNLIIQQLYPEDTSTEELIYYIRKGFNTNGNITWSKWFITNLYMEEYKDPYTRIIKGYNGSKNLFDELIPSTAKSIIFTDISMPSNATLIDVDEDGDGGVVAWLDTSDSTKMYVSTQTSGIKVGANFKWADTLNRVGLGYSTWKNEKGTRYTYTDTFPTGTHTYTKVS